MPTKTLETASYHFAVRIVKLAQKLQKDNKEFVLSREVLKCGATIGALISEAELDPNSSEYSITMHAALKQAKRTIYWLSIIEDTGYILETIAFSLKSDCEKLIESIELAKAGFNT